MIKKLFFRDSLWFGAAVGAAIPLIVYFLIYHLNEWALNHFNKQQILTPTTMQLLAICSNLILFRLYMLKWDKEESGKGMLLSTFLLAFIYIVLHRHMIMN